MKFWTSMAHRERRLVTIAGVMLGAALLYLLCFEPAWNGRKRLERELPVLRSELAQVDALSAEIRRAHALSQSSAPIRGLKDEVERSIGRAKLKALSVTGSDEALEVRFSAVSLQDFLSWQAGIQKELRVKTSRVNIARDTKAGLVTASMTLEAPRKSER